jgi:hypothetical protein
MTDTPLQGLRKVANHVNDFLHRPFVEWFVCVCVWSTHLLLGPLYLLAYLVLCLADVATGYVAWRYEEPDADRPIVISGCDTGFGHDLALALSERGWKVYAGCLTEKGMARLQSECRGAAGLVTVQLDVTKAEDIQALVDRVEHDHPRGLYALVNNAGAHGRARHVCTLSG